MLTPWISIKVFELILNNSRAVIIGGYGMGKLPENPELINLLKNAISKGILIAIST